MGLVSSPLISIINSAGQANVFASLFVPAAAAGAMKRSSGELSSDRGSQRSLVRLTEHGHAR